MRLNLWHNLHIGLILILTAWSGNMSVLAQPSVDVAGNEEYNLQLDRAIEWQQKADSLYHISVQWRKQAAGMYDLLEKGRLQGKIVEIEDSMKVYREKADFYFSGLNQDTNTFIFLDTVLNDISVYRYNLEHEYFTKQDEDMTEGDSIASSVPADSGAIVEFEIYKSPVYNPDNPFEDDFTPWTGTFYRIQLAVFSKDIPSDHFGGLFPVTTEEIPEKEMTRYFAGKFSRLENAEKALQRVRSAGYPDAYIVGYYNGVKSTPEKLRTLEKEQ